MGQLGAAEPAHDLLVGRVPVIHHDVVVGALLVRLQLELGEQQLDAVAGGRGEYPDALLVWRDGDNNNNITQLGNISL